MRIFLSQFFSTKSKYKKAIRNGTIGNSNNDCSNENIKTSRTQDAVDINSIIG